MLLVCVFALLSCVRSNPVTTKQQLAIFSFDGFRYDYFDNYKSDLPTLAKIAANGVHAKNGLQSVFQTATFPAHWSIATGLYEESHGLVANSFYDPATDSVFNKVTDYSTAL